MMLLVMQDVVPRHLLFSKPSRMFAASRSGGCDFDRRKGLL